MSFTLLATPAATHPSWTYLFFIQPRHELLLLVYIERALEECRSLGGIHSRLLHLHSWFTEGSSVSIVNFSEWFRRIRR